MKQKTIALIGCGALAHIFARNLLRLMPGTYRIVGVFGRTPLHAESFAETLSCRRCRDLSELIALKPDYCVEFAGGGAVREYAESVLKAGISFVAASSGALADDALKAKLEKAAEEAGSKLYIPCGAVGGFDLMQIYALRGGAKVEIGNRKAPRSLEGAPGLKGRVLSQEKEEVVFSGGVKEAIAGFPKNVNVAVATSLATAAPDARVTITSVPGLRENIHSVRLSNGLMHAELTIASNPDPANPKSSTSAAWSVVALFKNMASPVVYW